ncbi:MAG: leucine-rich repeat protein [Ruminococcus sp.]|nr:leucine-rich repeat protein [Ruminococcus sp.]
MLNKNKAAAFLMSLLICVSASMPLYSFADNETSTSAATEAAEEADEDIAAEEENFIESGDFSYSLTEEDTVCLQHCRIIGSEAVIPDTIDGKKVTELGPWVFGNDGKSTYSKIALPASLEYISSNNPFKVCMQLKEITIDAKSENFAAADGVLYSKDMTKLICYPSRKEGTSFKIPDTVSQLGKASIYSTALSEITFPEKLRILDDFAVGSNEALKVADLSKTEVSEVGDYGFAGCTSLEKVLLPENLYSIGGAAFYGCKKLEEIELPDKLGMIGQYAFMDTGLTKILVPDSVDTIGYCALGYQSSVSGEEVPVNGFIILGSYGSAAQTYAKDKDSEYGYTNDFDFRSPEENEDIQEIENLDINNLGDYDYAVENGEAYIINCNSFDDVIEVPADITGIPVTKIYTVAFSNTSASKIIIPENVKLIKKMAFQNCTYLKEVVLPQSLETIEDNVFEGCYALEKADLGGAKTIGTNVFSGCQSLKEVTFSGDCTSFGNENEHPFMQCPALESISVSSGDGAYTSKNGVLYDHDMTKLIAYPSARDEKSFDVPQSVKEIGDYAFYNASIIEEVDLSHVEKIGVASFGGCKKLKKAKLSKDLKTVGNDAFFDCKELESLRFYDSLESMGEFACGFYYDEEADPNGENAKVEKLVSGFKIYADKDTCAYKYAKDNDIEVITDTADVFGLNIDKRLLGIGGGVIGAGLLAGILSIFFKKKKAKKAAKEHTEMIKKAAEARKAKSEGKDEEDEK